MVSIFRCSGGTSRYQYGQCLGDVLRGIERYIPWVTQFLKAVSMKGIQILLQAGSKASKEGATVIDEIRSTLKPAVGAFLSATVEQVASKQIEMRNNQIDATLPNPPIMLLGLNQAVR